MCFNVSNTFKPDIQNEPFIYVVLFNVVEPLIFDDNNNVVWFLNSEGPLTFNDDINVE